MRLNSLSKFYLLNFVVLSILFFSKNSSSFDSDLQKGECSFYVGFGQTINNTRQILVEQSFKEHLQDKIFEIKQEIFLLENGYYQNLDYATISDIIKDKSTEIQYLKQQIQSDILSEIPKSNLFFEFKHAFSNDSLIGFNYEFKKAKTLLNELIYRGNFSAYFVHNLYNSKNFALSSEIGYNFGDDDKACYFGLNSKKVNFFYGKKLTNKINFKFGKSTIGSYYNTSVNSSIELSNNHSIGFEKFFEYNPGMNNKLRFYSREKIFIIKKLDLNQFDKINDLYVNFELHSDFIARSRKKISNGISFGIMIKM